MVRTFAIVTRSEAAAISRAFHTSARAFVAARPISAALRSRREGRKIIQADSTRKGSVILLNRLRAPIERRGWGWLN